MPRPPPSNEPPAMHAPAPCWRRLLADHYPWLVPAGFTLVLLATFLDYGITWDAKVQATYGQLVLDYFLSLGRDTAANEYLNLRVYGPVFELLCAAVVRLCGRAPYEIRHLLTASTAVLAVIGVMRYGQLLGGKRVAFLAALALVMMPRFYGHACNNPKDIPFAAAFVWGMYAGARLLVIPRHPWKWVVAAGVYVGLALAIRVGALLLVCFLLSGFVVHLWQQRVWRREALRRRGRWPGVIKPLAVLAIAWAIMVVPWPWAHQSPLLNPLRAFALATDFSSAYPVLFEGQRIASNQLPAYYLPKFLLITTPPVHLVLLVCGIGVAVIGAARRPRGRRCLLLGMVLLWLAFPLAYVLWRRPNVYDGIRHFLFLLPAMALLSGLGTARLLDGVRQLCARGGLGEGRRLGITRAATVIAVAFLLLPLRHLIVLHPYQATYFNALVGGVAGAWQRYETDYWATSYKEAAEWVNAHRHPDRPTIVVLAANRHNRLCAEYYLAAEVDLHSVWSAGDPFPRPFDYYVAMTRYDQASNFPTLPVVHAVGRDGAVFTVIKSPHAR